MDGSNSCIVLVHTPMYVNAFTFGAALFWMLSGNAPRYVGATIAVNLCSRRCSSCPAFSGGQRNDSEV
jgi:hypothetical protein